MIRNSYYGFISFAVGIFLCLVLTGCADQYPVSPNAEFICYGDSATRASAFDAAYPWFVQKLIYPYIQFDVNNYDLNKFDNRGQSGDQACGNERIFGWLDQGAFPYAHTVVYRLGANDLILTFCNRFNPAPDSGVTIPTEQEVVNESYRIAACIKDQVMRLKQNYGKNVIIARYYKVSTGSDAFCIGAIDQATADRINAALAIFHGIVQEELYDLGVPMIPAGPYDLGVDGYLADGIHPNAAGAERMAQELLYGN